jgi:hypothetical protein
MRLRRMDALCLAIVPDRPDGHDPVVACRDVRSGDCYGSPSNAG